MGHTDEAITQSLKEILGPDQDHELLSLMRNAPGLGRLSPAKRQALSDLIGDVLTYSFPAIMRALGPRVDESIFPELLKTLFHTRRDFGGNIHNIWLPASIDFFDPAFDPANIADMVIDLKRLRMIFGIRLDNEPPHYGFATLLREQGLTHVLNVFETSPHPWATCLATAPYPQKLFRSLLHDFDVNDHLAEWLTAPDQAWADMRHAFGDRPLDSSWRAAFQRIGKWQSAAIPRQDFVLAKEGHAIGLEVEQRNIDKIFEQKTPHTTDMQAIEDYLRQVQRFFRGCRPLFPADYSWSLHFNISISKTHYENFHIYQSQFNRLANMLFFPANSFGRNIYSVISGALYVHLADENQKTIGNDSRAPERHDYGRLEFKKSSIGADTDIPYLMRTLVIFCTILDNPKYFFELRYLTQAGSLINAIADIYEQCRLSLPADFKSPSDTMAEDQETRLAKKFERASFVVRRRIEDLWAHWPRPDQCLNVGLKEALSTPVSATFNKSPV